MAVGGAATPRSRNPMVLMLALTPSTTENSSEVCARCPAAQPVSAAAATSVATAVATAGRDPREHVSRAGVLSVTASPYRQGSRG